jgi:hypothetical protein
MLDHGYLKARIHYDLMTGAFIWKKHQSMSALWNAKYAGKIAGFENTHVSGYKRIRICIDKKTHTAAHLAWYWMLARWPISELDHINHDSLDNCWANLREVSRADNMRNQSKYRNNTSGVTGVGWVKHYGKWLAHIRVNGKLVNGGYFDFFEEACARRKELENEYGFHENHGT